MKVKHPNMDNYKKMAHYVKYIRATVEIPLTIEEHEASVIKWWIDSA